MIKIKISADGGIEEIIEAYDEDDVDAPFPKPLQLKNNEVNAATTTVVRNAKFDFTREFIVEAVYTEKICYLISRRLLPPI